MPPSPHRPYVPHRTPTRAQPAISSADFTLSKPFVPDLEAARVNPFEQEVSPGISREEPTLPSIETFVASSRPTVPPTPADVFDDELTEEPEELPPLEHFLDPLPTITDFSQTEAAFSDEPGIDFPDEMAATGSSSVSSDAGWAETDWQRYDWSSVAALGDTERTQAEASNAWATTDWEVATPRQTESARNPVDAIAKALDQIAERIRNGDLSIPNLSIPNSGGVADPSAIAATLAAWLGVKR